MALSQRLLALRNSPLLFKLPPYLSAICILVGVAWIFILPLDEYSRRTYISENAILPGQVHTFFGGSEHDVFRAFRQEMWALNERSEAERVAELRQMIRDMGLKDAEQSYSYTVAGDTMSGINAYGIIQGPRADATEAMVLIAAWKNIVGEVNYTGVALVLALARYFERWSVWSKDIIVLIPADSVYGPIAWVDGYHSSSSIATSNRNVSALPLKAGALQAAVALDYPVGPWGQRFDKLDIVYDGINGALPNLDLLNTAINIATGQMGMSCQLHGMEKAGDGYVDRLKTITSGLLTQGIGLANGPHSAFMPYRVDAITLKVSGDGWQDEMSLGRVTESIFRSVNNLLEHLHQSFFFYILLGPQRFVSIGNYLPAAMLIAGSFTITALGLWAMSGQATIVPKITDAKVKMEVIKSGKDTAVVPAAVLETRQRHVFLPAAIVLASHVAGIIPLYALSHCTEAQSPWVLIAIGFLAHIAVIGTTVTLSMRLGADAQRYQIMQSFSLLFLGAALATMATLNFSLAMAVGLAAAPLAFIRPFPYKWLQDHSIPTIPLIGPASIGMTLISPPVVLAAVGYFATDKGIAWLLHELAKGWIAQGATTSAVIWCIWWPAWIVSSIVMHSGIC